MDGLAGAEGSGVGVLLVSPSGEEPRMAIRLGFKASSDEAKYEVVLSGLLAARAVGAIRV